MRDVGGRSEEAVVSGEWDKAARGAEGMGLMGGVEVTVRSEAGEWTGVVRSRWAGIGAEARTFRGELGLAADRAVVMAGHQPQIWHPGILAKTIAIGAAGRAIGSQAAWVVVDQDDHDPWGVRYPVRRADGRLEARVWRMDGESRAAGGGEHVPVVNRLAVRGVRAPALGAGERFGAPGVESGLRGIAGAMEKWSGEKERGAAGQLGKAACELAHCSCGEMQTFAGTDLGRTTLFAELVKRMRADATRVIATYNAAVRRHPGARMAELAEGELPLWHIPRKSGAARKRVTVSMLDSTPVGELAPRALLMTGMLRWAGCELFVHGTGGAGEDGASGYDAITTEWLREWLGVEIAPTAMVTATVRLEISSTEPMITPEQIALARWTAHAARHRPALLKDAEGERVREGAVATLVRLKYKKDVESRRVKLEAFRSLHGALEDVRKRHSVELGRLAEAAVHAAARRAEAEIVADRTWAFPLYEPGQLQELKKEIERSFGG